MASAGEKQPGSLSRLVFLAAGLRGGGDVGAVPRGKRSWRGKNLVGARAATGVTWVWVA